MLNNGLLHGLDTAPDVRAHFVEMLELIRVRLVQYLVAVVDHVDARRLHVRGDELDRAAVAAMRAEREADLLIGELSWLQAL